MDRHWIAVACAEHVARGRAGGFMQVCHGKGAPLRRLRPGDRVVYYSPTARFGEGPPLQAFTALGRVAPGEPWQHDMGDGFVPWRRAVHWVAGAPAPIRPLLDRLVFTQGLPQWGARLRPGLVEIGESDMQLVAEAMGAPFVAEHRHRGKAQAERALACAA